MPVIFIICLLLFSTSSVLSTEDDETVLLRIKQQLGDPEFLQSWVKGFNFCNVFFNAPSGSFIYMGCTNTGRLETLDLYVNSFNTTARFPDAICDLTELKNFNIQVFPGLYGTIPDCVTKLPNLNNFNIYHTSLSGPVPNFYNHTEIINLNLAYNQLSGTIPSSLSTLPNLGSLSLASNNITGPIPPGLFHTSPWIPSLDLSNNNLTGEIPKCYGLVDFFAFDVGNNRLSGDASFLFGKQKNPYRIALANNEFEFDLSNVEFSDIITELDISHNKIYGKVPDSLATALELYELNLSFNRLCGELPRGYKIWQFESRYFENNLCLCGYPLPPCSNSSPAPAPVSDAPPF